MKRRDLLKLLGLGAATAVVKPDAALPAASETTVESIPLRAGGMRYVGYGGGFTAPFVETYEDFVREALGLLTYGTTADSELGSPRGSSCLVLWVL